MRERRSWTWKRRRPWTRRTLKFPINWPKPGICEEIRGRRVRKPPNVEDHRGLRSIDLKVLGTNPQPQQISGFGGGFQIFDPLAQSIEPPFLLQNRLRDKLKFPHIDAGAFLPASRCVEI